MLQCGDPSTKQARCINRKQKKKDKEMRDYQKYAIVHLQRPRLATYLLIVRVFSDIFILDCDHDRV